MNSIAALANIGRKITAEEVDADLYVTAEFLDYLRWLADQDTSQQLNAGQVWELYYEGIHTGRAWSEVCEDLGLPVRKDW
jgi:hypothetical protein